MLSREEMMLVWIRVVVAKTEESEEIQKIFRNLH